MRGDSLRGVYFYELHEADDELAIGMTLAHDEAFAPSEFLAMVETARSRVIETFTEETLIEAIAAELEREHDFAASLDSRLVAAVGISSEEGETRLLAHEGPTAHAADEGEEEDPDAYPWRFLGTAAGEFGSTAVRFVTQAAPRANRRDVRNTQTP